MTLRENLPPRDFRRIGAKLSMVLTAHLTEALFRIPDRQRKILEMKYGIYDGIPKTLIEIGYRIGLTKQRCEQIEKEALVGVIERITDVLIEERGKQSKIESQQSGNRLEKKMSHSEMLNLLIK